MGRILFLVLLIVEIGAAVGFVAVVVGWSVRQSKSDVTVPLPAYRYAAGLPLLVAVAVVIQLIVDPSPQLARLWWMPLAWCAVALLLVLARRVQYRADHRGQR